MGNGILPTKKGSVFVIVTLLTSLTLITLGLLIPSLVTSVVDSPHIMYKKTILQRNVAQVHSPPSFQRIANGSQPLDRAQIHPITPVRLLIQTLLSKMLKTSSGTLTQQTVFACKIVSLIHLNQNNAVELLRLHQSLPTILHQLVAPLPSLGM